MERISIQAGRRSGKPCIRDTRITVYDVLGYLASGMSETEILTDFPDLTREDILACYAFAAERDRRMFSFGNCSSSEASTVLLSNLENITAFALDTTSTLHEIQAPDS